MRQRRMRLPGWVLAVTVIIASIGAVAPPGAAAMQQDGHVLVTVNFCEPPSSPDDDPSKCGQAVDVAPGTVVTYTVTGGNGEFIETIEVVIDGNQLNVGSATGGHLEAGGTYTVCQTPVAGFDVVPVGDRPGGTDLSNQTVSGDCIIVELRQGTNPTMFSNIKEATTSPGDELIQQLIAILRQILDDLL